MCSLLLTPNLLDQLVFVLVSSGGPRHDKRQDRGGRRARGDHAEGGQSLRSQLQLPQRNVQPLHGHRAAGSSGMKVAVCLFCHVGKIIKILTTMEIRRTLSVFSETVKPPLRSCGQVKVVMTQINVT